MLGSDNNDGRLADSTLGYGLGVGAQLAESGGGGEQLDVVVVRNLKPQVVKYFLLEGLDGLGDLDADVDGPGAPGEHRLHSNHHTLLDVAVLDVYYDLRAFQPDFDDVYWLLLFFLLHLLGRGWGKFWLLGWRGFLLRLRLGRGDRVFLGVAAIVGVEEVGVEVDGLALLDLPFIFKGDNVEVAAAEERAVADVGYEDRVIRFECGVGHDINIDQTQSFSSASIIPSHHFNIQFEAMMDPLDDSSPQAINETYKIWKKNVPFLYNLLQVYELPTCSQTVDWIPERYVHDSWQHNKLVIGSNSLTKNYIMVIDIKLPTEDSLVDYTSYKEMPNSESNVGTLGQQVLKTARLFPQNGQVMRSRVFKGENSQLLASCVGGENFQYFVYELSQDPEMVEQNKITLEGHGCEGFGLDWHPTEDNYLVSGAFDKKMCLWNLKMKNSSNLVAPERVFEHSSPVEDTKWCRKDHNLIGSATQAKLVQIWDVREPSNEKPAISKNAHKGEVFSLDFSYHSPYLLLTGGDDSDVNLWDTRNMQRYLQTFIGHNDSVSGVKWSAGNPYTFTSSSFDRRTVVWDMRGLMENREENSNEEILFIHGGHRSKVLDFCYNPEGTVCASTEQSNILHVWRMNQKILQPSSN